MKENWSISLTFKKEKRKKEEASVGIKIYNSKMNHAHIHVPNRQIRIKPTQQCYL